MREFFLPEHRASGEGGQGSPRERQSARQRLPPAHVPVLPAQLVLFLGRGARGTSVLVVRCSGRG